MFLWEEVQEMKELRILSRKTNSIHNDVLENSIFLLLDQHQEKQISLIFFLLFRLYLLKYFHPSCEGNQHVLDNRATSSTDVQQWCRVKV